MLIRKTRQRITAMMLSVIMALGMMPVSAAAETGALPIGAGGEIAAFEVLGPDIIAQSVPLGTSSADLELPDTLKATIRLAPSGDEPLSDSGDPDGGMVASPADTGGDGAGAEEIIAPLPATWASSPEYDGEAAGTYLFAPDLPEGFVLAPGVEAPKITVVVETAAITGAVTAFDVLPNDIRWQNTTAPEFPETVVGTVEGEAAKIPVTWVADHDYDAQSPQRGLYVFTAVLGEGYASADGVGPPRITIYIPQTAGRMARMAGVGTDTSPLEITTAVQLAEIAALVNARAGGLELFLFNDADARVKLVLQNDIDLSAYASGEGWVPIGTNDQQFKATLDGGGHQITGLFINRNANLQGLFGFVGLGGMVENLGVVNTSVTGIERVGGVVGYAAFSTVQNCYVTGSVSGSRFVGGVAGFVDVGTVQNCYSTGRVYGSGDFVGGVAGYVYGTVQNCYATGSVTGFQLVGGVAGFVYDGTVQNCYSTGNVSGSWGFVGGVAGYVYGTAQNCYSTGNMSGLYYVGGVAGCVDDSSTLQSCAALGASVTGTSYVGRVAGSAGNVGTGTLSGNIAFSGMTATEGGSPKAITDHLTGLDGASKTAAEIGAAGFFEALFGNEAPWTYEVGKLPGFSAAADMPAHIVDGSDPNFRGAGTSGNPYQISTPADLAKLAELVNAGGATYNAAYYELINDLDLSDYGSGYNGGEGWTPIGHFNQKFIGSFNGNGHQISELYINRSAEFQGLFGCVGSGGTVESLGIVGASVTGYVYVGGVAAYVDLGTVQNSYVTGSVSGYYSIGGVAGRVYRSSVQNCYSAGSVSGSDLVGGVAGYVDEGTVQNSYSTSNVSGNFSIGGVVGRMLYGNGTMENCYSTGSVTGNDQVGGVVGFALYSQLENCYATGSVTGLSAVGGLVGTLQGSGTKVQSCAALNLSVRGTVNVGRIVGLISDALSLFNCAFSGMTVMVGDVPKTIEDNATGLDGASKTAAEIAAASFWTTIGNWRNTAPWGSDIWTFADDKLPVLKGLAEQDAAMPYHISGSYFAGGGIEGDPYQISTPAQLAKLAELVNAGDSFSGKYFALQNDLDLSRYGSGYDGGKGWISIGTYEQPFSGLFDGGGHQITGLFTDRNADMHGLFGFIGLGGIVENLGVVNANITGLSHVGGVAGFVLGTIQNCYSTGFISGTGYVGGIAGRVNDGTVQNCYSTASVYGSGTFVGGIEGFVSGGTVQNCYSTGHISGSAYVGGVAGLVQGTMRNCAALTPSVSGTGGVGRVVGDAFDDLLSGNYALSRIPGTWENKGPGAKDGADVTVQTLLSGSFWTTEANWEAAAWDSTIWTLEDGKLPTLTGLAGQSGGGGLHLTVRDIQYAAVTPDFADFIYNGSEQVPTLAIAFGGEPLLRDTDYTVEITDPAGIGAGTNAGTVTLTITGIGSFFGTKTLTYTIAKKPVTVTPASGQSKKYGQNDPALIFINNGGLDADVFIGALSHGADENVGSYPISLGNLSAGANYALSLAPGTVDFTIEQREITLAANDKTVVKGSGLPALTYTVNNLAPDETRSDALSVEPVLSCPTFDGNTPGSYDILLTGGTATGNYTITTRTNGTLYVAERTYTVTFNLNGGTHTGGGELTQTIAEGSAATAPAVSRIGYTFTGWDKNFDNVTSDLMVTARWNYNNSGSSFGDSSTTTTPEKTPDQPITTAASVTATAGQNGTANASVPDNAIADAIAKAQADAKAQGKTANGIGVNLNVHMPQGTSSLSLSLPQNALQNLVNAGVTNLTINGGIASLGLDLGALKELQNQSAGNVTITIKPVTNLSATAKKLIGQRPVYDVTVSFFKAGKLNLITSLGKGVATLSFPYTPGWNEAVGWLFGVYVDGEGNASHIPGSAFDINSGSLILSTNHFSIYGVGYTAPTEKYIDIASHWAKVSIDYVVGRGLFSGTTEMTFSPDMAMERGMLVTVLGRLAGADMSAYKTSSFTDVAAGKYYLPYVEWANQKGIISGIGGGKFAPERAVTREEIALILQNYAKATGYKLPVTREIITFADNSSIDSSYASAVNAMQQAGIMMGGSGNKLNPKSSATRAEVSTMLHRYSTLTIDPATAQGWALSDAGQYLYFKDGKMLTGW